MVRILADGGGPSLPKWLTAGRRPTTCPQLEIESLDDEPVDGVTIVSGPARPDPVGCGRDRRRRTVAARHRVGPGWSRTEVGSGRRGGHAHAHVRPVAAGDPAAGSALARVHLRAHRCDGADDRGRTPVAQRCTSRSTARAVRPIVGTTSRSECAPSGRRQSASVRPPASTARSTRRSMRTSSPARRCWLRVVDNGGTGVRHGIRPAVPDRVQPDGRVGCRRV